MHRLLSGLAAIILFILMLLGTADVIGRYFFAAPIPGASELIELLMAALVFAVFPVVTAERQHIMVDFFNGSPQTARIKAVIGGVVVAACLGLLAYCVNRQAGRVVTMGDVTDLLRIPKGPIFYYIAASCALALFLLIWAGFRSNPSSGEKSVS